MAAPRIYVDTSVVGGCFDSEFEVESRRSFGQVRQGRIRALVSDVVAREVERAPPTVRELIVVLSPLGLTRATEDAS
jgi:hypothetical protein